MSASRTWNEYPYISVKGLLGAALVCVALWTGMRLAGSSDRNRRLIAFGLLWYLIALIPVSNLIPSALPPLLTGVEFANSPPGAASVQTFAAFDPRQPRCSQRARTTLSVSRARE